MPRRRVARRITNRQFGIIERLSRKDNPTQPAAAEEMGISVGTLKNHLQMAYRTLGVSTLAAATRVLGLPAKPLFDEADTRRIYQEWINGHDDDD